MFIASYSQTRNLHDRRYDLFYFLEKSCTRTSVFRCSRRSTSNGPTLAPVCRCPFIFSINLLQNTCRPSAVTLTADPRTTINMDFDALVAVSSTGHVSVSKIMFYGILGLG